MCRQLAALSFASTRSCRLVPELASVPHSMAELWQCSHYARPSWQDIRCCSLSQQPWGKCHVVSLFKHRPYYIFIETAGNRALKKPAKTRESIYYTEIRPPNFHNVLLSSVGEHGISIFWIELDRMLLWILCRFAPWWLARLCEIAPKLILSNKSNQNGRDSVPGGSLVGANRVRNIEQSCKASEIWVVIYTNSMGWVTVTWRCSNNRSATALDKRGLRTSLIHKRGSQFYGAGHPILRNYMREKYEKEKQGYTICISETWFTISPEALC